MMDTVSTSHHSVLSSELVMLTSFDSNCNSADYQGKDIKNSIVPYVLSYVVCPS